MGKSEGKIIQVVEKDMKRPIVNQFNKVAGKNNTMKVKCGPKGDTYIFKCNATVIFDCKNSKKYKTSKPKLQIQFEDNNTLTFFKDIEDRVLQGVESEVRSSIIVIPDEYDPYMKVSVNQSSPGESNVPIWLMGDDEPSYDLSSLVKGKKKGAR